MRGGGQEAEAKQSSLQILLPRNSGSLCVLISQRVIGCLVPNKKNMHGITLTHLKNLSSPSSTDRSHLTGADSTHKQGAV